MNLANRPPAGQKTQKQPRDRAHMARVAELPCVICGKPGPSEVHHCICGRYGQRRASDRETIPLCIWCHRFGLEAIHSDKAGWIARNGNDFEFLPVVADMLAGEWNNPRGVK